MVGAATSSSSTSPPLAPVVLAPRTSGLRYFVYTGGGDGDQQQQPQQQPPDDDESDDESDDSSEDEEDGDSDSDSYSDSDDDLYDEDGETAVERDVQMISTVLRCPRLVAAASLLRHRGDAEVASHDIVSALLRQARGEFVHSEMPLDDEMRFPMGDDARSDRRAVSTLMMLFSDINSADDVRAAIDRGHGNVRTILADHDELDEAMLGEMWPVYVCSQLAQHLRGWAADSDTIIDVHDVQLRTGAPFPVVTAALLDTPDEDEALATIARLVAENVPSTSEQRTAELSLLPSITNSTVADAWWLMSLFTSQQIHCATVSLQDAVTMLQRNDNDLMSALFRCGTFDGLDVAHIRFVADVVTRHIARVNGSATDDDSSSSSSSESDDDDEYTSTSSSSSDEEEEVTEEFSAAPLATPQPQHTEGDQMIYAHPLTGPLAVSEDEMTTTGEEEDDESIAFVAEHVPWVPRECIVATLAQFDGAVDETIVALIGRRPRRM